MKAKARRPSSEKALSKSCFEQKQDFAYTDVLIVGAGIAGLSAAIKLAERFPERKVTIFSKDGPGESNSRYAQGGIAVVVDRLNDSFQQHINDTLLVGDGLCEARVVEEVVRVAPQLLEEIMRWGARFDFDTSGGLALGLEGGHSAHRIVHAKDHTGFEIVRALLSKASTCHNIEIYWNCLAIDLVTVGEGASKRCAGAKYILYPSNESEAISAAFTILSTGGAGQVFEETTNPEIATGDGIAMAVRAGAATAGMQFIQFHPTALQVKSGNTVFLISEALRGFGAYLCTANGHRFMFDYDARGEMAPRDVVARAIGKELMSCPVYIDCRHLPPDLLIQQFPNISQTCMSVGIDISKNLIPVKPAAHYLCGGIVTNLHAQTSLQNLYAIGECACTGLHGANRLASNSLLEALAFSHWCFEDIEKHLNSMQQASVVKVPENGGADPPVEELKLFQARLKALMTRSAGLVRTDEGVRKGLEEVKWLGENVEAIFQNARVSRLLCETRNMLQVAELILQQSLSQRKNKGTFFNEDLAGLIPLSHSIPDTLVKN